MPVRRVRSTVTLFAAINTTQLSHRHMVRDELSDNEASLSNLMRISEWRKSNKK